MLSDEQGSGDSLLRLIASSGIEVDVMLVAYMDESGHSGDSRIVAMGGVVGSHVHMEALADSWRKLRERHNLNVFHMSELESYSGEFIGWSKDQREALLADVFSTIKDLWIMPFGSAVVIEGYQKLPALNLAFCDPWFICFQLCVSEVAKSQMWHRDDPTPKDKIAVFHDRQMEYQGRAVSAFHYLKDSTSFGHRLGTITSGSMGDVIQLQLADLVAFEIRKMVENAIYYPEIPPRWPMKRIQEKPFLCNVVDFTGRLPELQHSEFSVIRRMGITITGDDIGFIGWPHEWSPEKAKEAIAEMGYRPIEKSDV